MRLSRLLTLLSLVVVLTGSGLPGTAVAQDKPAAAKKPAKKAAEKAKPPAEEWKELVARRQAFIKTVESMQERLQTASQAERQKLVDQFRPLQAEFQTEVLPRMFDLAPEIFKKDPNDLDAAEIVVNRAYNENQYQEVLDLTQKLLGAGKKSAPFLNIRGVAQFALHDFEGAKATLLEAKEADPELFAQLGAKFFESCDEYVDYWEHEQALREKEAQADDLPRVLFKTSKGDIVLELFENEAPNTVANFISLVEKKKYDGIAFHRVIANFMAQGGDPNTLDNDPSNDGGGGPGYTIACECYTDKARKHFQGSLSMAHAGKDTGGSQFFLTHLPTAHLNYTKGKDGSNHTVFGRVIKGMDVAWAIRPGDKIESAKVLRKRDHEYKPKTLPEKDRISGFKK